MLTSASEQLPNLTGLNVLVTRPRHQAIGLSQTIVKHGGTATLFPTLEIQPVLDPNTWIEPLVRSLEKADFLVFVSANAVFPVASYLKGIHTPILAVGPGTEAALTQRGYVVQQKPFSEYSAQGLLQLPQLKNVANKQIIIFSGENGQLLLRKQLESRGACVTLLEVYRRVCPKIDIQPYLKIWRKNIHVVVSTSLEGLKNWAKLLGKTGQADFKNYSLVVITNVMKKLAIELQLGHPILVARHAGDEAILQALSFYNRQRLANGYKT